MHKLYKNDRKFAFKKKLHNLIIIKILAKRFILKKMKILEEENHNIALFIDLAAQLKDHRRTNKGNLRHSLPEILFLTLSAMLAVVIHGK